MTMAFLRLHIYDFYRCTAVLASRWIGRHCGGLQFAVATMQAHQPAR
jgi:hypothetical protein